VYRGEAPAGSYRKENLPENWGLGRSTDKLNSFAYLIASVAANFAHIL